MFKSPIFFLISAFWVVMNAWRLSSRLWACALVLTLLVVGLELVWLPVVVEPGLTLTAAFEEPPPKMA